MPFHTRMAWPFPPLTIRGSMTFQRNPEICLSILGCFLAMAGCSQASDPVTDDDEPSDEASGGDGGGEAGQGGDTSEGGQGGEANEGGESGSAGSGGQPGGSGGSGMAGAGMGGTMTPAGGSGGQTASAPKFSANFENGVVGQAPPSPFTGGQGRVDSTQAFSGTKSIKVTSASGSNMFSIQAKDYIAANRKTAYTRFMVYMDGLPGTNPTSHWDLIKYQSVFKGGGHVINGFLSYGGFAESSQKLHMFGSNPKGEIVQDCSKQTTPTMETKKWVCVEMKVDENAIITYGISLDGKPVQTLSFIWDSAASNCVPDWNITAGKWYVPEVNVIQLGFNHVHTQTKPVTLWIDDVAIDSKPIGCPTK